MINEYFVNRLPRRGKQGRPFVSRTAVPMHPGSGTRFCGGDTRRESDRYRSGNRSF